MVDLDYAVKAAALVVRAARLGIDIDFGDISLDEFGEPGIDGMSGDEWLEAMTGD